MRPFNPFLFILCGFSPFILSAQNFEKDHRICDSLVMSENYEAACTYCLNAWNVAYSDLSIDDSVRISSGITAGNSLIANGRYSEAYNVFQQLAACCMDPEKPDENYLIVCESLTKIAGDPQKLIDNCKETVRVIKALYGDDESLVDYYYTLGEEYLTSGDYAEAQKSYLNAADIYMKYHDVKDLNYARIMIELSSAYISIGLYNEANEKNYEALKIIESTEGEKTSLLSDAYQLLVWGYNGLGNFDSAIAYTNKVIEISYELPLFEKANALVSSALYIINFDISNGTQIAYESDFANVLNIVTGIYDSIQPEAIFVNNLLMAYGNYYVTIAKYDSTVFYYKKSTELVARTYGRNNIIYLNSLATLGSYYELNRELDKAAAVYDTLMSNSRNFLNTNFIFLTENQQESMLENFYRNRDIVYGFYHRHSELPGMAEVYFENEVVLKGILLRNITSLRNSVRANADSSSLQLFNEWITMKQQLAEIYLNNMPDTAHLQSKLTKLELKLAENKIIHTENETFTWKMLRSKLEKDEAAVEYLTFHELGILQYYAIVITKNADEAALIYLGNEFDFDSVLSRRKGEAESSYIKRIYSTTDPDFPEDSSYFTGDQLYNLVWDPIVKYIKGKNKIYISPSGILHQVSFNAIPLNTETRLINLYNLQLVSSTKNIHAEFQDRTYNSFLLAGGISYNNPQDTTSHHIIVWRQLPGTYSEVNKISGVIAAKHMSPVLLFGPGVNELYFKSTSVQSFDVMHIATHGYFYSGNSSDSSAFGFKYKHADNSLFRSGLILAGGNSSWVNNTDIPDGNDGILTAYEISNLNLSSTKLLVLSACETGLGDIKGSEGVYGLQRSFKMAGVDEIVMSLWQVPDNYTIELMDLFYSFLLNGYSAEAALKQAQIIMEQKTGVYNWGAFILIE